MLIPTAKAGFVTAEEVREDRCRNGTEVRLKFEKFRSQFRASPIISQHLKQLITHTYLFLILLQETCQIMHQKMLTDSLLVYSSIIFQSFDTKTMSFILAFKSTSPPLKTKHHTHLLSNILLPPFPLSLLIQAI